MTDPNAVFAGSIPENYDRYLGPVLFEPYARDLARRVDAKEGARVLEVACGTGIVTRRLRERLPAGATFVASDLNPPMLEYARRRLEGVPGIEWRPADACVLPFAPATFDILVCQFGLMFVPDKKAALQEDRRVLVAGGRFFLSVWDSLDRNAFAKVAHETVARIFPEDPPAFYQVPFSLHDTAALAALLRGAGFEDVRVDPVSFQGESPSAHDFARGLVEGNPMADAIRQRGGVAIGEVVEAVAKGVAREFGDRPVRVPLHAFVLEARAGAD